MAIYGDSLEQSFNTGQTVALERGNILASSLIHVQSWAGPHAAPSSEGIAQKVLIKLYDEDTRAFKLNDMVTFIGVLEYSTQQS